MLHVEVHHSIRRIQYSYFSPEYYEVAKISKESHKASPVASFNWLKASLYSCAIIWIWRWGAKTTNIAKWSGMGVFGMRKIIAQQQHCFLWWAFFFEEKLKVFNLKIFNCFLISGVQLISNRLGCAILYRHLKHGSNVVPIQSISFQSYHQSECVQG